MQTPAGRNPAVISIAGFFDDGHLPEHLQPVSKAIHDVAEQIIDTLPDGPELTTGLRKLLEAKDCFVRASVAANP